jgi:hypothetical protein
MLARLSLFPLMRRRVTFCAMPIPNARMALCALVAALTVIGSPLKAERKMPDELPSMKTLPDPLVKAEGSKLASKEQWAAQRDALKELVLAYEYGHLPPGSPVSTSSRVSR